MIIQSLKYIFRYSLVVVFIIVFSIQASSFNVNQDNHPFSDTSAIDMISKEPTPISSDSASKLSSYLLSTDPIFMDHWTNEVTFVYGDIKIDDLPEKTVIPLISKDQKFTLTWYGRINSNYERRWGRQHRGIDINLKTGDSVLAAFDGVVRYAQFNNAGFGNCVIIRHLNGLETVYGHMSRLIVKPNDYVTSGQLIGLGGTTGHSFGPHLHFETRYKDFSFNPLLLIDINTQKLISDTFVLSKEDHLVSYRHPVIVAPVEGDASGPGSSMGYSRKSKSYAGHKRNSGKKTPVKGKNKKSGSGKKDKKKEVLKKGRTSVSGSKKSKKVVAASKKEKTSRHNTIEKKGNKSVHKPAVNHSKKTTPAKKTRSSKKK